LGKVAIPSELLNKPTRLTAEELALVKTHVQAMSDDRPYRTTHDCEAALQELERGAGVTFDAEVIRVASRSGCPTM
jgi:HD-GYP domain-containing protein (c-di-GMP phosphodiesterase class II)